MTIDFDIDAEKQIFSHTLKCENCYYQHEKLKIKKCIGTFRKISCLTKILDVAWSNVIDAINNFPPIFVG